MKAGGPWRSARFSFGRSYWSGESKWPSMPWRLGGSRAADFEIGAMSNLQQKGAITCNNFFLCFFDSCSASLDFREVPFLETLNIHPRQQGCDLRTGLMLAGDAPLQRFLVPQGAAGLCKHDDSRSALSKDRPWGSIIFVD